MDRLHPGAGWRLASLPFIGNADTSEAADNHICHTLKLLASILDYVAPRNTVYRYLQAFVIRNSAPAQPRLVRITCQWRSTYSPIHVGRYNFYISTMCAILKMLCSSLQASVSSNRWLKIRIQWTARFSLLLSFARHTALWWWWHLCFPHQRSMHMHIVQ